jgi:hypothetical protein
MGGGKLNMAENSRKLDRSQGIGNVGGVEESWNMLEKRVQEGIYARSTRVKT